MVELQDGQSAPEEAHVLRGRELLPEAVPLLTGATSVGVCRITSGPIANERTVL